MFNGPVLFFCYIYRSPSFINFFIFFFFMIKAPVVEKWGKFSSFWGHITVVLTHNIVLHSKKNCVFCILNKKHSAIKELFFVISIVSCKSAFFRSEIKVHFSDHRFFPFSCPGFLLFNGYIIHVTILSIKLFHDEKKVKMMFMHWCRSV